MVETQIRSRGIHNEQVNRAMSTIPRHRFVAGREEDAYGDFPLSIGYGQTISQPYMVALMTAELSLSKRERVLEVGTGSGYQTAVLAVLADTVYTIELIPALQRRAQALLTDIGYKNIRYRSGDGSRGWEEQAPFDRILVAAAAAEVPVRLKEQLADSGILIVPVDSTGSYQTLMIVRKVGHHFEVRESIGCRFVPLISRD